MSGRRSDPEHLEQIRKNTAHHVRLLVQPIDFAGLEAMGLLVKTRRKGWYMSPNAHALPNHVSVKIDAIEIKDGIAWVRISESTMEQAVQLARKFRAGVVDGKSSAPSPGVAPKKPRLGD